MATVSVARPLKSRMHPMRNLSVVPTFRTHSRLPRRANHNQPLAHPASMKGRFGRPSRRVGRGCDGRGWHDRRAWRTRTAKSRGPDLPTLGSSLPVMNGRRRWLSSPDTGEHGAALTPSCRECRLIRLDLWSLPPAFFVCRRAMGEAISRHSRRPLQSPRANYLHHSGASAPRARADMSTVCALFAPSLRAQRHVRRSSKSEGGSHPSFPLAWAWIAASLQRKIASQFCRGLLAMTKLGR
jgi:hypothetical protein